MRLLTLMFLAGCGLVLQGAETDAVVAPTKPWETGALGIESGVLWEVGSLTSISYRLVPTQFSWRSKQFLGHVFADGSRLIVRHRLTLIATWIQSGPESHYFGVSGSPSIEWRNPAGTGSLFTGAGGGVGWANSGDVPGGLGQDCTFIWFIRGGIEHALSKRGSVSAVIMYQHMSEGGQTD